MTVLDAIIVLVILVGLWRGFRVGAIKTIISFFAWLLALVVASALSKEFAVIFMGVVNGEVLQISLAFLVIVLVVVALAHVVSWIALKTLNILKLGFLDKLLGGVLGATKGVVMVLVMLSILSPILVRLSSWQESILAQSLLPFAPVAHALVSEVFNETRLQMKNPYH